PISPGAAAGLAALAGWAAAWLELVARVAADLPGARLGPRPTAAVALAIVACWLGARRARLDRLERRRVGELALVAGTLSVVAVVWIATRAAPAWIQPGGLRVTFLDVGQ